MRFSITKISKDKSEYTAGKVEGRCGGAGGDGDVGGEGGAADWVIVFRRPWQNFLVGKNSCTPR